jgi:UDP-2,3-diacylglucosamine pyrophosphatase LpxH
MMQNKKVKTQLNCAACGNKISKHRSKNNYCSKNCEVLENGYSPSMLSYKQVQTTSEAMTSLRNKIAASCAYADNVYNRPLHIVSPVTAIASDIHVPNHCPLWLERFLITSDHFKARDCIIAGDLFTQTQFSNHVGNYKRSRNTFDEELDAAEKVINLLCEQFKEVFFTNSNHDEKILRKLGGEIGIQRFGKMITDHKNVHFSPYSYCVLNNDTFVGHPRGYSKIRGKKAADISQVAQKNIITGHEHHSAKSYSQDAKHFSIANGCLVDTFRQEYVRLEMPGQFAEPMNGFTIAWMTKTGTRAMNFDTLFPWKMIELDDL